MDLSARLPLPRPPRRTVAVDVAWTAATALIICLSIAVFREPDARTPDALAYVMGAAVALPLLVRRRAPLVALFGCYVLLMAYYWTGYPAIGFVLPLAVALTTAAAAGHLAAGSWLVVVGLTVAMAYRITDESEAVLSVIDDTVRDAALAGTALLLGQLIRSRRQLVATTRERVRLLEESRDREAADRIEAERLRLARELHDALAHTVTVIGVQADVADELLEDDPAEARRAVRTIRGLTADTLTDLRRTVGALRGGRPDLGPPGGVEGLDTLLARVRASGVDTHLEVDPDVGVLLASVDATVHRVAQESLTNVLRHADATRVEVRVRRVGDRIDVRVRDDGRGGQLDVAPDATGGHGLTGMRERVALLGGSFAAGPGPDGGFEVHATLPAPRTEPSTARLGR